MKIILKTLTGKQLPLEVQEHDSLSVVKMKIEEEHKMQADQLKLIAYGKVMEGDQKTLKDYQIKEGDNIVVMIQKVKPQPKPKTEEQLREEAQAQEKEQNQAIGNSQQQPNQQQNTSQQDDSITELMAISGKSKEICQTALTMAKGDANLAFEIIMQTGNLEGGDEEYGEEEFEDDGNQPVSGNMFEALAQNPNFALIRQRILQDPGFYQQFLSQLSQTQPEMFQLIQSNPAAFMNLVIAGDPNTGLPSGNNMDVQDGYGEEEVDDGNQNPNALNVTEAEMEAIERLASLGFSKHKAAEAYFSCDKNEELAANFLFESGGMEDDEAEAAAIEQSLQHQNQQNPNNDKKEGDGGEGGSSLS